MSAKGVRHTKVAAQHEGQRLDNWLMRHLKGVPRSLVYRLLRTGQVRVNGSRARPGLRLSAGDEIRVPPVRRDAPAKPPKPDPERVAAIMAGILYEDERLVVLDKPAGLAVHAGSGIRHGLIEILNAARSGEELHLVHRLDRETSGCLLLAKRRDVLRELHGLMREGAIGKHYLVLMRGAWEGGERVVDARLAADRLRGGERMVEADAEAGRSAVTRFKPLEVRSGASFAEAVLDTGRKHQIRVHAAHIGHPVAGDRKYGDPGFNRQLKKLGLRRLFLHAHRQHFCMSDGREIDVSAPLPDELRAVLDALGNGNRHSHRAM